MLLTDAGIQNPSIHAALVDLLGKPIEECNALAIPTSLYGHPKAGPRMAYKFFTSTAGNVMLELGWKTMAVLELTALPTLQRDIWVPLVEEADVFLVAGGDCAYLAFWMKESGLVDFAIFPHVNSPGMPDHSMQAAERWFETMDIPAYLTDEQTAIKVVDGVAEVVSEGTWKYLSK